MRDESREETRRALYENVASGRIEIAGEQEGEHTFRMTDEGNAQVEAWLDEAIDQHGERAADAFAQRLEIPVPMAAEMIEHRLRTRGEISQPKDAA